jgi:hypothetical protein
MAAQRGSFSYGLSSVLVFLLKILLRSSFSTLSYPWRPRMGVDGGVGRFFFDSDVDSPDFGFTNPATPFFKAGIEFAWCTWSVPRSDEVVLELHLVGGGLQSRRLDPTHVHVADSACICHEPLRD